MKIFDPLAELPVFSNFLLPDTAWAANRIALLRWLQEMLGGDLTPQERYGYLVTMENTLIGYYSPQVRFHFTPESTLTILKIVGFINEAKLQVIQSGAATSVLDPLLAHNPDIEVCDSLIASALRELTEIDFSYILEPALRRQARDVVTATAFDQVFEVMVYNTLVNVRLPSNFQSAQEAKTLLTYIYQLRKMRSQGLTPELLNARQKLMGQQELTDAETELLYTNRHFLTETLPA